MPCAALRVGGVRDRGLGYWTPSKTQIYIAKLCFGPPPPPRQTYISLPLHRKQKSGSARYDTLTDTSLPHYVFVLDRSHFIVNL